MAEPYNYALQTTAADPNQSVIGGIKDAIGIASMLAKRDADQQAALDKQAAREKEAALQNDLARVAASPTAAGLSSLMIKYPSLSENFKRTFDVLSQEAKDARISQATQVYAALQANQPDVAQSVLRSQAAAYRNSNRETDAKVLEDLAALVEKSPQTAMTTTGLFLASSMGGDKFAETFTKLESERRSAEKHGPELDKAKSDAQKAATEAKFAEQQAVMDLQKKGWDITKIQEDIKIARQNAAIAAANLAIAREGNALKKQELQLKVLDMTEKRDQAVRDRVAETTSARDTIDNMLNTADRVLNSPLSAIRSATGPVASRLPTLSAETSNFEALVETLGAQAFTAQIPSLKGMGALSDAEGKKLQAALQNLSLKQSPEQLLENVREAQRLMLKARKTLVQRSGLPDTVPDTPAAASGASTGTSVEALVRKYSAPPPAKGSQ